MRPSSLMPPIMNCAFHLSPIRGLGTQKSPGAAFPGENEGGRLIQKAGLPDRIASNISNLRLPTQYCFTGHLDCILKCVKVRDVSPEIPEFDCKHEYFHLIFLSQN
jgi:hypothetical protein